MANIVLKSLRVKNFGPFADEICFTTATDKSKKEYPENTFQINNTEFNRIAFIYGANGSGKSNFCKAILQIQNFINLYNKKFFSRKCSKKFLYLLAIDQIFARQTTESGLFPIQ